MDDWVLGAVARQKLANYQQVTRLADSLQQTRKGCAAARATAYKAKKKVLEIRYDSWGQVALDTLCGDVELK